MSSVSVTVGPEESPREMDRASLLEVIPVTSHASFLKQVLWVLWARINGNSFQPNPRSELDTLRENCGIIRKQASTDGGVLWKVMCVDVVQVR
ncbi:hypothetical protein TNCV_4585531 [Trichonephila clavipes]|nr:hypothetical protein TNCV_4585531 [Trichonephila clavipes]